MWVWVPCMSVCVKVRQSAVEAASSKQQAPWAPSCTLMYREGRACGMTMVVDWMDVPEILRPRPRAQFA